MAEVLRWPWSPQETRERGTEVRRTTAPVPRERTPGAGAEHGPQVSRGIRWAAHAAAFTAVPTGVWRIAIALGWDSGFRDDFLGPGGFPGSGSFYLVGLSLVAELVALLTLGLVRRWGEVLPRWVPWLGGRTIPTAAAMVPALAGALVVTLVTVLGALEWNAVDNMGAPEAPEGFKYGLMTAAYVPLLAWGPLLFVVAVAYGRRRRRTGR
ncbi:hypothetical protein ACFYVL_35485 [Streptomyces sp. NPDC004111]|uniref:hypothetical protein n=1 Tax=Streptomyces sp. NPDC004111 TaxID=3364690 RepID=UPI0036A8CE29